MRGAAHGRTGVPWGPWTPSRRSYLHPLCAFLVNSVGSFLEEDRMRKRNRRKRRSGVIDEYDSNEDDAGHSPTLQIDNAPRQPVLRKFPVIKISQRNRSFSPKWYSMYPWISYSITTDEATCFACSKFGYRNQKQFVFKKWSATTRLEKHAKSVSHGNAMKAWLSSNAKNIRQNSVANQLARQREEILMNRAYLTKVIETLVFLVQQNIAIRGTGKN